MTRSSNGVTFLTRYPLTLINLIINMSWNVITVQYQVTTQLFNLKTIVDIYQLFSNVYNTVYILYIVT